MSSPIHSEDDRNGPSMYAPRWARRSGPQEDAEKQASPVAPAAGAQPTAQVTRLPRAPRLGERGPLDRAPMDRGPGPEGLRAINFDDPQFEGDVAVRQLMLRQTLDPQPVPPPPARDSRDRGLGMAGRFVIAAGIAAAVAFVIVSVVSESRNKDGTTTASLWSRMFGLGSSEQAGGARALPRLFVENRRSGVNQPIGLGIQLSEPAPGAFILMRGLSSRPRANAGTPVGEGSWRIPTRALPSAPGLPPMNFA